MHSTENGTRRPGLHGLGSCTQYTYTPPVQARLAGRLAGFFNFTLVVYRTNIFLSLVVVDILAWLAGRLVCGRLVWGLVGVWLVGCATAVYCYSYCQLGVMKSFQLRIIGCVALHNDTVDHGQFHSQQALQDHTGQPGLKE